MNFIVSAYSVSQGALLTAINLGALGARLDLSAPPIEISLSDDDGILSIAAPGETSVQVGGDDQGPVTEIAFRRFTLEQDGAVIAVDFAILSRAAVADVLLVPLDRQAGSIAPADLIASDRYAAGDPVAGFDIALEIPPDNVAPVTADDSASVAEGSSVAINVLANDSDADGDTLTLVAVSGATLGAAVISGNRIVYTPDPNADGIDSFTYTISDGTAEATGAVTVTVTADDILDGTGGSDSLTGTSGDDTIRAGAGNDTIDGGEGDDVINTGIGFDVVDAGGGNDLVQGLNGFDTLNGGAGSDTLQGNFGNDELNGGDGDDELQGGVGFDVLRGDAGNDLLVGRDGFDTLEGGTGNDTLQGNAGNDSLSGGDDDDLLIGGIGSDVMSGDAGDDLLQGQGGFDTLDGGAGNDTLQGNNSDDLLNGGDGDDRLEGGFANDVLNGDAGNDTLEGGNGFDALNGGAGDDRLEGNAGNDTLDGGAGNDVLRGGLGADTFVFRVGSGNDTVLDFGTVDSVEIEAALLGGGTPEPLDLIPFATRDADGFLLLDFGNGDTLTFTDITNTGAILGDVSFI